MVKNKEELTDEKAAQVSGGVDFTVDNQSFEKEFHLYTIPTEESAKRKFEIKIEWQPKQGT